MIVHCCLDVRGAMRMADRDLRRLFVRSDGNPVSVQEALDFLCEHVAMGHAVIPLGEECDGFDYQRGCPGHLETSAPIQDVSEEART